MLRAPAYGTGYVPPPVPPAPQESRRVAPRIALRERLSCRPHEWGQETHFNNLLARIIDGVFLSGHASRDSIPISGSGLPLDGPRRRRDGPRRRREGGFRE